MLGVLQKAVVARDGKSPKSDCVVKLEGGKFEMYACGLNLGVINQG